MPAFQETSASDFKTIKEDGSVATETDLEMSAIPAKMSWLAL